jgi:NACalpha-BTF3-like transcription factor
MIKLKNNQVKDLNRMMKESIIRMESLNVTVLLIVGKKRSWTADEDAYLIKLVQKYGAQKWTSIA